MPTTATSYEHIEIRHDGAAIICGTTTKVIELVVERRAYGWSPEEIHFQHAYLSLGQIYSALAYYADHATELDLDIERRMNSVEELANQTPVSPAIERLNSSNNS